jgi:hypothetical protein
MPPGAEGLDLDLLFQRTGAQGAPAAILPQAVPAPAASTVGAARRNLLLDKEKSAP